MESGASEEKYEGCSGMRSSISCTKNILEVFVIGGGEGVAGGICEVWDVASWLVLVFWESSCGRDVRGGYSLSTAQDPSIGSAFVISGIQRRRPEQYERVS